MARLSKPQIPRKGSPRPRDFNPHSPDSMFSKIIERLDSQDDESEKMHDENKNVLDAILVQAKATNGRVTKLEMKWIYAAGFSAGIAVIVGLLLKYLL